VLSSRRRVELCFFSDWFVCERMQRNVGNPNFWLDALLQVGSAWARFSRSNAAGSAQREAP